MQCSKAGAGEVIVKFGKEYRYTWRMTDKEAAKILTEILKKHHLSAAEEEAVRLGIGMMAWMQLAENKLAVRKAKREREKLED